MKLQFFTKDYGDLPPNAHSALGSREAVTFEGMTLSKGVFGYCFTYLGYITELPTSLEGRKISKVVLWDDNSENFPARGTYRRSTTNAVVDTDSNQPATKWYITITGKTLPAVLRFYDDIRTGAVQPQVNWSTKVTNGTPADINRESVAARLRLVLNVTRENFGTEVPLYRAITALRDELGFTDTDLT